MCLLLRLTSGALRLLSRRFLQLPCLQSRLLSAVLCLLSRRLPHLLCLLSRQLTGVVMPRCQVQNAAMHRQTQQTAIEAPSCQQPAAGRGRGYLKLWCACCCMTIDAS